MTAPPPSAATEALEAAMQEIDRRTALARDDRNSAREAAEDAYLAAMIALTDLEAALQRSGDWEADLIPAKNLALRELRRKVSPNFGTGGGRPRVAGRAGSGR